MPGGVELSNLQKVFWPDDGLTKGDLIEYFASVGPAIVPHLHRRPLTLKRYPDGIQGQSFYQKQTPDYAPEWVTTATLPSESSRRKEVRYTIANDRRTLRWLANQAAIELHPWLSRIDRLDRPDYLVMDIDPPADGSFDQAVRVALLVRTILAEWGVEGVAKTSGAKGVHIYVPLRRVHSYEEVRRAAERIAAQSAEREPRFATAAWRKAERAGRVFIDFTRTVLGSHIIAPYSPRAKPGAPVSFPVHWKRLPNVHPLDFNIRTVPRMIERADPWRLLCPKPQRLPSELTGPGDDAKPVRRRRSSPRRED